MLYGLPESLNIILFFALLHFFRPITFYRSPFLLNMSTHILLLLNLPFTCHALWDTMKSRGDE